MPTLKFERYAPILVACAVTVVSAACLFAGSSNSPHATHETRISTISPPTLAATTSPVPTTIPSPTSSPLPSNTPTPAYSYTIHLVGLDIPGMRAVYLRGRQNGKDRHVFSKVMDSEGWRWHYLQPFDANRYDLGPYGYLQGVVDQFRGSFKALGQTVHPGFPATADLDPTLADPRVCSHGETPLECEYRTARPSIALIMVRTWNYSEIGSRYDQALRSIISASLQDGVIPVVSTIPHQYYPWRPVEKLNAVIRAVAAEYHVPLWDLVLTTDSLPTYGVTPNNNHLSLSPNDQAGYLIQGYMQFGIVRHNLEALEVLHMLLTQVMY